MKRTGILRFTSLFLLLAMLLCVAGCNETKPAIQQQQQEIVSQNLMDDIEPQNIVPPELKEPEAAVITDFALRLFGASKESGQNTLISPLSVLYALSMTANGAEGDTLTQMETVLGMPVQELNEYLYSYVSQLPMDEKYKLSLANSIWFTADESFTVNQDFLQTNADYYGADIYKAAFDGTTLKDINNWVKQETDGMIPSILDEIPELAVMYLINALAFDAEWADVYQEHQVREGTFTTEDGTKRTVDFMYSAEGSYLADENACGFIKYYKDRKYAFVALLPDEGIGINAYLKTLDGAKVQALLNTATHSAVHAAIPKFETEYSVEMSKILTQMGMGNAFSGDLADFSGLGTSTLGNIFISRVLHKTFISVGEKGTKAGAATVVEMEPESSAMETDPQKVYLDRPFVYMLVDCQTNIPFFIGTMMDVKG